MADNYIAELPFGAPAIDDEAFVAPTAVVVGAVSMGPRSSIWYGAVARADQERIEIGAGSNVQDGCTLHSDPGFPLVVGRDVTVGHRVVLHGARIDDEVLVGMGSVVMNGAHIGSGSIVAAGAVVTQGKQFPPRSVIAGVPATVVREATDDDLLHIRGNAAAYSERLPEARRVRPVVRRALPSAGHLPGDDMP
ncbi:gamma carbonic anhydrase family protein [Blastococcus sp. DSM 46786]|uniref:gamma carbonic anhydrase family protein n=1 Tax=Blastococcus sp. DSM 46786 TaxID=1798227 RepID=UPI001FCCF284|nr:gamma carbonic anhydrase family protein [Blastococcus sp. DSM 46786]